MVDISVSAVSAKNISDNSKVPSRKGPVKRHSSSRQLFSDKPNKNAILPFHRVQMGIEDAVSQRENSAVKAKDENSTLHSYNPMNHP